jgi:catalase
MPEITHMLMWAMSDRAIPRSYRMMQGFGVHTYRLVNADGESHFVKFHWNPKAGTHSLVWDEAVKISGADSDFHRRDLWEAIEAGAYPEWELGTADLTEEQARASRSTCSTATKIVPEELVPSCRSAGWCSEPQPRQLPSRKTEQVPFCVATSCPASTSRTNPLLAGRIHSYVDTQISRLGGPTSTRSRSCARSRRCTTTSATACTARRSIAAGSSYEPNSLAGDALPAGAAGFVSFPEPRDEGESQGRGKAERFADHYTQAALFWNSQTDVEKQHIINAFRFELSRVQTPAVRERMVSGLLNVSPDPRSADRRRSWVYANCQSRCQR